MSTRYVYSVYNTTVENHVESKLIHFEEKDEYPFTYAIACNEYEESVKQNRSGQSVTFYDLPGGSTDSDRIYPFSLSSGRVDYRKDTLQYRYVIVSRSTKNLDAVDECYLMEPIQGVSGGYWHIITEHTSGISAIYAGNSSSSSDWSDYLDFLRDGGKPFYKSGGVIEQGSTIVGTKTSRTSLPSGAFNDSGSWRWRVYKGSDNIDPTAVTYSKSDLYPGDTVTINVTPRTPTYGGTVYYQYQYTTDGTTWKNLGSKTTSTTAAFTIPEDVEHFQARVLASDGWGFVSTTYINGPSLGVSQLKAYGTVSGTILALKKGWCVVGGKVKSLERGYVTVNGVWEKIF